MLGALSTVASEHECLSQMLAVICKLTGASKYCGAKASREQRRKRQVNGMHRTVTKVKGCTVALLVLALRLRKKASI